MLLLVDWIGEECGTNPIRLMNERSRCRSRSGESITSIMAVVLYVGGNPSLGVYRERGRGRERKSARGEEGQKLKREVIN